MSKVRTIVEDCELTLYIPLERVISTLLYTRFICINTQEVWTTELFRTTEELVDEWRDPGTGQLLALDIDTRLFALADRLNEVEQLCIDTFKPIEHDLLRHSSSAAGVDRVFFNNSIVAWTEFDY